MISRSFIYKRTLTNSAIYFPFRFIYVVRIIGSSLLTVVLNKISNLTIKMTEYSRLNNINKNSDLVVIDKVDSKASVSIIGNSTIQVK